MTTTTTRLISTVDIYYKNIPIFSKIIETETVTGWFLCSTFRIDLLEPKEHVPTWKPNDRERELWAKDLQQQVTLSWILIDPETKRAMNVSTFKPVSVERHWLTGDVQMKFVNAMVCEGVSTKTASVRERVECEVVVTWGGEEKGEMHVREVYFGMEDMDGKSLNGRDSLVILKGGMEGGLRKKK